MTRWFTPSRFFYYSLVHQLRDDGHWSSKVLGMVAWHMYVWTDKFPVVLVYDSVLAGVKVEE